jgi:hypothetical protein
MKWLIYISTLICAATEAADPPKNTTPAVADQANEAVKTITSAPRPLDLRLGDIRRYITPEEYRALMGAPAMEANTVVVKADAPLLPMKTSHDIPGGILTPFWALANPHKIWRLVLPDPRVDITKIPPPETPVPPREFRWGP